MTDHRARRRDRAGKGDTVGGAPAADALLALVSQFSERTSFVRELIQNALDAGSGRVDVVVSQKSRTMCIEVIDDGEGMDRDIIEGYLLTLFRSTKENDLTKIGKFGVGFVSLFALNPTLVTVDTARDGVHHRVVFDKNRDYTLAEVETPFEGTRVALWVKTWSKPAGKLANAIRAATHYWCRFARAEITVEGRGAKWRWPMETVEHAFTVDAPVVIHLQEEGFRAAIGYTKERPPMVGYYNRGLTLLEERDDAIPGVCFRVEAKALEHTLTRDNVKRDAHYNQVMAQIRAAVKSQLAPAHLNAIASVDPSADPERYRALLTAIMNGGLKLPDALPALRSASGKRIALATLNLGFMGVLRSTDRVFWAPGPSAVVTSLEAQGHPVLLGPPDMEPEVRLVRQHHTRYDEEIEVDARYICPTEAPADPLVQAAADCDPKRRSWHAGHFEDGGQKLKGRLAIAQPRPFEANEQGAQGPHIVVNVRHPLFLRLATLSTKLGAPLLCWMARRAVSPEDTADFLLNHDQLISQLYAAISHPEKPTP